MPNFTAGTSFTDGVTNDVTAAKLNALVADAVPTSSLALTSTNGTIANFTSSTANITLGTIPTLTAGTTTGTAGIFTSGTITAALIPTGTFGTTTSTAATITNGTIPTGTFGTTTSTAATITTGTIPTLTAGTTTSTNAVVTNGTITNLSATTSTFLGTITGSTNVVNIGSGQIYKDASGNVGIGTASPTNKLTVYGESFLNYDGASGLLFRKLSSENRIDSYDYPVTAGYPLSILASTIKLGDVAGPRLTIDTGGGVTIAGLAGAGSRAVNASAAGLLSAASDASLKEEVVGAHIAGLSEILQIHPKMYRWKDDIANRGENASVELGFIANEVAPIIPSAAPLGNDGLYGFYDRSITAALVKAVQELKAENDSLKSRIEALEAK
ncbi:MAG: tail fiber domain-containing protein [Microbacteriaceae bacterium]|nr:tail fiber domain-containing protein [Microbacteriaceae bacterium]NBS61850.1 tail fiber domain-containing protein [Microbacteriaceae bacterium]